MASAQSAWEGIATYLAESVKLIEHSTLEIAQNWMKSVTAPLASETGGIDKHHYDSDFIQGILQKAVEKGELQVDTPVASLTLNIMNAYYGAVAVWCITNGEKGLCDSMDDFCAGTLRVMLNAYKKDMHAAASLGMQTYLVTDCRIPAKDKPYTGPCGTFAELVSFLSC